MGHVREVTRTGLEEGGTEVVGPLRDAVRFVHDDERHLSQEQNVMTDLATRLSL